MQTALRNAYLKVLTCGQCPALSISWPQRQAQYLGARSTSPTPVRAGHGRAAPRARHRFGLPRGPGPHGHPPKERRRVARAIYAPSPTPRRPTAPPAGDRSGALTRNPAGTPPDTAELPEPCPSHSIPSAPASFPPRWSRASRYFWTRWRSAAPPGSRREG